jgi:hypothetical protein
VSTCMYAWAIANVLLSVSIINYCTRGWWNIPVVQMGGWGGSQSMQSWLCSGQADLQTVRMWTLNELAWIKCSGLIWVCVCGLPLPYLFHCQEPTNMLDLKALLWLEEYLQVKHF